MIYFPDEEITGGWADPVLKVLGYDTQPRRLQALIKRVFELATVKVSAPRGVTIVPLPLFKTLDGKRTGDYISRVEPSASGGRKMANSILDAVEQALGQQLDGLM